MTKWYDTKVSTDDAAERNVRLAKQIADMCVLVKTPQMLQELFYTLSAQPLRSPVSIETSYDSSNTLEDVLLTMRVGDLIYICDLSNIPPVDLHRLAATLRRLTKVSFNILYTLEVFMKSKLPIFNKEESLDFCDISTYHWVKTERKKAGYPKRRFDTLLHDLYEYDSPDIVQVLKYLLPNGTPGKDIIAMDCVLAYFDLEIYQQYTDIYQDYLNLPTETIFMPKEQEEIALRHYQLYAMLHVNSKPVQLDYKAIVETMQANEARRKYLTRKYAYAFNIASNAQIMEYAHSIGFFVHTLNRATLRQLVKTTDLELFSDILEYKRLMNEDMRWKQIMRNPEYIEHCPAGIFKAPQVTNLGKHYGFQENMYIPHTGSTFITYELKNPITFLFEYENAQTLEDTTKSSWVEHEQKLIISLSEKWGLPLNVTLTILKAGLFIEDIFYLRNYLAEKYPDTLFTVNILQQYRIDILENFKEVDYTLLKSTRSVDKNNVPVYGLVTEFETPKQRVVRGPLPIMLRAITQDVIMQLCEEFYKKELIDQLVVMTPYSFTFEIPKDKEQELRGILQSSALLTRTMFELQESGSTYQDEMRAFVGVSLSEGIEVPERIED